MCRVFFVWSVAGCPRARTENTRSLHNHSWDAKVADRVLLEVRSSMKRKDIGRIPYTPTIVVVSSGAYAMIAIVSAVPISYTLLSRIYHFNGLALSSAAAGSVPVRLG